MKKVALFLFPFVPLLTGGLMNLLITGDDGLSWLVFLSAPLFMLVIWFWVGRQYAKAQWPYWRAVLVGNSTGMLVLVISFCRSVGILYYDWNSFISHTVLSYSVPLWVLERTPSSEPPLIAFIVMVAIFSLGYLSKKAKSSRKAATAESKE